MFKHFEKEIVQQWKDNETEKKKKRPMGHTVNLRNISNQWTELCKAMIIP